jgi:flagellar biosynthetic protein FliR
MARVTALVETAPLLSSDAVPQLVKAAVALFISVVVFPAVIAAGYQIPGDFVHYVLLLTGEVLIGIIIGFFLTLVYAVFQVAGQFFSLQMGFGASEVYDPLAQIEIPLVGQFLNLVAMLVLLIMNGFQKFMYVGVYQSFLAIKAVNIVGGREKIFALFLVGLSRLFESALTISFPILGILFLVSVSMGLLAKAAPQMNLLMMGFPLTIGVAYIILLVTVPFLVDSFSGIIDTGFNELSRFILEMKG